MYLIRKIKKHTLPIIITNTREVQFSIRFLHMFHHKFANATRALIDTSLVNPSPSSLGTPIGNILSSFCVVSAKTFLG